MTKITALLLLGAVLLFSACEDLETEKWPGTPTILSSSELERNGFMPAKETNNTINDSIALYGYEESADWTGDGTKVRIIYGNLVGTDTSALKIGPVWKNPAEAVLCLDFPVPNTYESISLDARARLEGLKLSIAVGDYEGKTVYESVPINLTEAWQRGLRVNLRQQDGWRLRGEEVYSRSFPALPISSLRLIITGETKSNAAVVDNISFK